MVDEEDRKNEEKHINNIKRKNKFSLIFCCIFYQHFFNSIIQLKLNLWLIRHKKNIKEIFRIEY